MVQRRVNPYAKAYSFGTDGNAALAGSPISSYRPMEQRQRRRARRRRGVILPRWVYVTCITALVISMFISYSEMNGRRSAINRDIAVQTQELAAANARIEALNAQIAEADDEVRMRATALNRLGMKDPVQDQVYRIPVPYIVQREQEIVPEEGTSDGFFRVFLSMFIKD